MTLLHRSVTVSLLFVQVFACCTYTKQASMPCLLYLPRVECRRQATSAESVSWPSTFSKMLTLSFLIMVLHTMTVTDLGAAHLPILCQVKFNAATDDGKNVN